MAASSNEGHCTVEAAIDSTHDHQPLATASTAINGHDLGSHSDPNHEATAPLPDGAVVGDKRKRENGEEEMVPPVDPFRKTSLCSYFRSSGGSCRHGDACKYAHGEEELRPRPDGSWDPTSKREKRTASDGENDDGNDDNEDQDGDEGSSDVKLEKCIKNVPRRWKTVDFIKFLDTNGIPYKTAKKVKHQNLGFIRFENEEQMSRALKELEGKSTGGNNTVEVAEVRERKFIRPSEGERKTDSNKDNPDLDGSNEKSARDVVTPLAQLSYDDQLEGKRTSLEQMLKRLTRNARKACPAGVSLPDWILKSREIGGLPCKLEGIVASPIVFGYRNKCEFTIGNSLLGKPTVGFTLGNFREGMTAVGEPVDCPNVSTVAQKYTSIFQDFLQDSALPVWDRHKNAGFWRQFTVREGRKPSADAENVDAIAEVMLIIQVSSISFEKDVVAREFERLAKAFSVGAASSSPPLPLTALVVQEHQGISNVAPADAPLQSLPIPKAEGDIPKADGAPPAEQTNDMVDPRIHDYISNLRFSISPTAFFQVNTLAAEKLYSLAGDWAGLDADTLLFDVCCGTGTIGLTLAHRVGMVVGIEMNASAVADAHRNAEINGIKNCRFVCSKAEDVMGSLLKEYITVPENEDEILETAEGDNDVTSTKEGDDIKDEEMKGLNPEKENGQSHNSATVEQENKEDASGRQFKKVVAIVDPPRGGLHPTVIKALRTHPNLRKLVYISCNPESFVANAIELCSQCPENDEKGKKDNRGWRHMSNSGIARRRLKSMPKSEPFSPVKAMAVDLFPHTPHCEVVVLLER